MTTTQSASGEVHPARCWEWFEAGDPACGQCMVATKCEVATKNKQSGKTAVEEVEEIAEEPLPELSPWNYLEGKMSEKDMVMEEKEKGGMRVVEFKKDGALRLRVSFAPSGKIKVQSSKGAEVLNSFESQEQVDEVLSKYL